MAELTAETIQRGRGADQKHVAKRRKIAHDVRTAREKLTSSIGLERAFDYELVRLFAKYRVSATIPLMFLALAVSATSAIWVSLFTAVVTSGLLLTGVTVMLILSRQYLRQESETVDLAKWRRIFIVGELIHGVSWAIFLQTLAFGDFSEIRAFILFVLLIVAAVMAMLSATIPFAVYAGLTPMTGVIVLISTDRPNLEGMMLVAMSVTAQLFFVFLARRLHTSAVDTLASRAEKDTLFGELEQAKANSDEARRRAEEANLAKSRFLATMSHELRTPLNAILGFSEVMKNEVFGPHASPAYQEYSGDIHGSGQHLLNLINEILDLSRIEAGRYDLKEEAVRLAYIVEDCRHMMNLRAKAKGQVVKEAVDTSLPRLWADERAVRQVVLNVLSNAIKFTPQGGEISIKVGWTSSGGQYVSIKDTGPGIPEDEIPIVMSSFGRGAHAIKTAEQGSGLGLPIVKGLVDLHGGSFVLKSEPREGTEVIITFPASRVMDTLAPVSMQDGDNSKAA
jgi:two-component system, cell cycle sensor histidine kinase PleC